MKIGVISDLHIDTNSNEQLHTDDIKNILVAQIKEKQIDLLAIAGDISNDHQLSQMFIENIKKLTGIKVLFVPGNHDYWEKEQEEKHTHAILEFFKTREESIIERPFILNEEWAIVGHSGWYDHTFADKRFSDEELSVGNYNERIWQDKLNVDWKMEDKAVSKEFVAAVEADLEKVKDKKIILMTHMVTYRNFGVKMPHLMFDYFNAFIGTSDFDHLFEKYNIKYNIMGHVHYRRREENNGITHICACVGNRNEWQTDDYERELKDAMQVIELI